VSCSSARLGVSVAVQVTALQPIDEKLCLLYVSAQRGCFHATHRACPAVPAGDILAFHPGQLGGHMVQLMTQSADQPHGLGGLAIPHDEMVASPWPSRRRTVQHKPRAEGSAPPPGWVRHGSRPGGATP